MKFRTFLMPALVIYLALGNLCILTKAYALPIEGPSGVMSYAEPKSSLPPRSCPFAKQSDLDAGQKSPCADGHCYKYQPPDDSASRSHTNIAMNGTDVCPPPTETESLNAVSDMSRAEKLWEPPPPEDHLQSVVRLE